MGPGVGRRRGARRAGLALGGKMEFCILSARPPLATSCYRNPAASKGPIRAFGDLVRILASVSALHGDMERRRARTFGDDYA